MKIKISAAIFAPGWFQFVGGRNPPIFTKDSEIEITHANLRTLISKERYLEVDGLYLKVQDSDTSSDLAPIQCKGRLSNVSQKYLEKLQEKGWVLDPHAANEYGIPNDDRNACLQGHIREQTAGTNHLRTLGFTD